MKKLSCGGVIFSVDNKLLIIRPRWDVNVWNIPKGEINQGETEKQCALREIEEETGIKPSMYGYIFDIGRHLYLKSKDVHLFHMFLNQPFNEFKCNSFYTENGKQFPENVDFKWIDWSERNKYVSKPIQKVLSDVETLLR